MAEELAEESAKNGSEPVQFLFIHHSCGGQLLADAGPQVGGEDESGQTCIYVSHPNGGGLRSRLESAGFAVNESSYGSIVGEDTDICHWRRKFTSKMDDILRLKQQDTFLPEGMTNRIVAFKSCYPNNGFRGAGNEPGDPDSCELTVANAKAAYRALLSEFAQHPEVLFVAFTAPPQVEPRPRGMKARIRAMLQGNRKSPAAGLAREFNSWLVDTDQGWLAGDAPGNVVVFDYYDILTDHGKTNWSAYGSREGRDSHPSTEGNRKAADAFVPFIHAALAHAQHASSSSQNSP